MGVSCNIYLEPHAKTEQIFEVILKVLGNEFEHTFFDRDSKKNKQPDFTKPCDNNNSWYLRAKENPNNRIELKDVDYFQFIFEDIAKNQFYFNIHLDSEDGHLPFCKNISPNSMATYCAVGKRLVDFFGGKLNYSDCDDLDDPKNYYLVDKPKFPARTMKEEINERWHLYYNLLNEEPILTVKEIKEMTEKSAYDTERDKQLISYLEKYEQVKELENELSSKSDDTKTKKVVSKV